MTVALVAMAACDEDVPGTGRGTGGAGGNASAGTGGQAGPTAGTGGSSAGTGGQPGSGGSGGSGADGPTDTVDAGVARGCNIPCIAMLIGDCVPGGACVQQTAVQDFATHLCYENGVTVTLTAAVGPVTFTFRRPGGEICYTVDVTTELGSESGRFEYKTAGGQTVASGTFDRSDSDLSVECDGQTYQAARRSCLNLPLLTSGSVACTQGSCQP